MNRVVLAMLGSLVALGVLVWSMSEKRSRVGRGEAAQSGITILCAASNRAVMDEICQDYFDEFAIRVETQYGPSQSLLSNLEVSSVGDLYLPADSSYLDIARQQGLIDESLAIARMQGVVAVKKGNPKKIHSYEDLLRDDVRLVQANPEAAAIGAVTKRLLQEVGKWKDLQSATAGFRTTVTDAATDVVVGAADAAIVYDAVLYAFDDLEYVKIDELREAVSDISIGVASSSENPRAAFHFARFITARDRGLRHYEQQGFGTVVGDKWNDAPELTVYAGSMLRPAIEDVIEEFSEREGVVVRCVFNGCGILVGQMKTGAQPDAYFACDSEFMTQVADLFPEPVDVSQNELAILVKKGNPFNIRTLRDLTKPDVRVGIGHEKQCAMGWLTQQTFTESGIKSELMENVTVQSPTGDMLVNQLLADGLDAAVAYLSNAAGMADELEALPIEGLSCSIATQPWAVREGSDYPNLADRLFTKIVSAENQEVFAANGFRWQLDVPSESAATDAQQ
ncbi:MAG: hypothetical protein Aurels2KO_45410 [Aureliella sp.]